ncbi:MAG: hypothetical protein NW226_20420 [Microscillaceae bacterium]|nr:hypothetical protein [Microscillaceae bacterium]
MIKRSFEHWLFEDVEKEFGIVRIKKHPSLLAWLDVKPSGVLHSNITRLQDLLEDSIETWNEDELKMMFIAPLLTEINFNYLPHYKVFTQRLLYLQTENVEASGKVEWMVATGKQTPQRPFFFLHEYKAEKNTSNDPLGQLLIAMVDSQMINENPEKLLFGAYAIGRFWFFVILQNKEYSVSRAYDATQKDDLSDIVLILEKVKHHIHQELALPYEVKA